MYEYDELINDVNMLEDDLDLADDQAEALIDIMLDTRQYIPKVLKIQDKKSRLIPFVFNEPQNRLYDEIEKQQKEGRPVRIIILKARQMGFSTAVSAIFYHESATKENTNSAIVAHKEDASTGILDKMKLYYEESPEIFKPSRKACNAKMLLFENPSTNENIKRRDPGLRSKIIIESAVNKNALRSKTVHNLHLSELAFWPYPEETMTSAMQAVPHEPGTMVIIESTAHGVGGAFYEEWIRAVRGESEFVPMFFPWFEEKDYRMPVPDDYSPTDEESELIEKYHLEPEQIVWRRWCISANCGGDINRFKQEYPAEWHEAFLASGRPVFDTDILDVAMQKAQPAPFVGRVIATKDGPKFRTETNGYLSIWQKPQAESLYVIGIDPSSGSRDGDPAAMAVYECATQTQVAEWHGYMPPDLLGEEAVQLGIYYNNALLIPEANNHGVSCLDSIKRAHYRNIYRRRTSPDRRRERNTDNYGWWTSEQSKKLLIDGFAKFIREGVDRIKSKQTLNECVTYVRDDRDRTNAQSGCHDDRVIANALAAYAATARKNSNIKFKESSVIQLYGVNSSTGY